MHRYLLGLLAFAIGISASSQAYADVIPSPANDLASQANFGVAVDYSGLGSWDAAHTIDKLNDGNRDGNFGDNPTGLFHSAQNQANGGTVGVLLAAPALIGQVNLFDRTDCCSQRIDAGGSNPFTLQILLGGVPQFTQNYTFSNDIVIPGADGLAVGTVKSIPNVLGDEVRITQNNPDFVNLAELEVYQAVPEPASISILAIAGIGLIARRRRA